MRTLSLAIVFAILAWTASLNMARAGCGASPYDEALRDLKARYDLQALIYYRAQAGVDAATFPEVARIYANRRDAAAAEVNRILDMKTIVMMNAAQHPYPGCPETMPFTR